MSKPKRYYQHFKNDYTETFSFIKKSHLGSSHAFCTWCNANISIAHGGKRDILLHSDTAKHKEAFKIVQSNQKIQSSFFESSSNHSVINAECLFTAFLIEHNLPINCSDHAGKLFKKMFPDSDIAKNYGCARTKTSAILKEMSLKESASIVDILKTSPFCIATDGSNDIDSKLYPIVVTFFNPLCQQVKNCLLCVPSLQGDATGKNIGHLLISELKSRSIPISNCVALSSDNAPVMIGNKAGVAFVLKQHNENIVVMGCSCHLINLAAEKGAACLPFKIDEVLVDIYYYLQKSSKRKDRLKVLQEFYETDIKKVLKHVSTRWLSVDKCLTRIIQQWQPLITFFKEEAMKKNEVTPLAFYTIPSVKVTSDNNDEVKKKDKPESRKSLQSCKRKFSQGISDKNASKKQKVDVVSQEERLFYFLSSDINKAFCLFLSYIVPIFEKANVKLQSADPHIHLVKSMLLDLYRDIILKFVKPNVIKFSSDILQVQYHDKNNQKCDADLLIGNNTLNAVQELIAESKDNFYESVRHYFETVCDYMRNKFPFNSEILHHAEVAQILNFENASFSSIKYFVEKFPAFLFGEINDDALDALQVEFCEFQAFHIPEYITSKTGIDLQWSAVGQIKSESGDLKFKRLSQVMLAILTIPHSNAECERVFSQIKKNRTEFRSSLSNETLEQLLIVKSSKSVKCFENVFDKQFLHKAKSCTTSFVNTKD